MARIAGVNIPPQKRVEIGLTYIYGIGRSMSNKVLGVVGIDPNTKVRDLTEEEIVRLREAIDREVTVEGRPAARALAEHQAPDGHRLLPWHPPPSWHAGERAAHAHQRALPQGS